MKSLILLVFLVGCGVDDSEQVSSPDAYFFNCQNDCNMTNWHLMVENDLRIYKTDNDYLYVSNEAIIDDKNNNYDYIVENFLHDYMGTYTKIDLKTGNVVENIRPSHEFDFKDTPINKETITFEKR